MSSLIICRQSRQTGSRGDRKQKEQSHDRYRAVSCIDTHNSAIPLNLLPPPLKSPMLSYFNRPKPPRLCFCEIQCVFERIITVKVHRRRRLSPAQRHIVAHTCMGSVKGGRLKNRQNMWLQKKNWKGTSCFWFISNRLRHVSCHSTVVPFICCSEQVPGLRYQPVRDNCSS